MLLAITVDSDDPFEVAAQMGYYLNGLAQANRLIMRRERIPALYKSGVHYRVEPWAATMQSCSNCREVWERRWGCCKSLSAWKLAELREAAGDEELARGYDLAVTWKDYAADPLGAQLQARDGVVRVFHVAVLLPNGKTEDPSARLRRR